MIEDNQIGKVIKSYELQGLVGTGGFGAVYRATQDVIDREVAIKIIWPAFANHPNFIKRFEAEAQLVAGLEHPYIVPLYDYWRDPDGAYIVMRFLRGGALRDVIDGEKWSLNDLNRLVNQVGSALGLAHRYGVVHRDIKPGNILLDDDGNAYLADFGIAQIVSNAQPDTDDMMMGMGSPAYAAPEQIIGNVTTPESDIYSLGIILYELLTGQHPFPDLEDLSMTALNSLRATGTMPTILDKRLDVTRALNDVLQKATAINPRDRFQDAMAFARAFHNASGSAGRMYASAPIVDSNATIPNPYKGLRAFQETDAPNFFGRDALVERLISRMREESPFARFLAVVGPSGSGKSSVVRAGLIPALRDGAVEGAENWYYDQVIPGEQPFSEIENAIVGLAVDEPDNLMEQLLRDDNGLLDAVNTVLPEDDSEFFLFIDQFEEVFTLADSEAETARFLRSLYTAVTAPNSRMRVVITIRADFYDKPLLQPRLSDMVRERTEVVVPLSSSELERVIIEPARNAGVMVDHGLVAAIIAEVKEQPGSLPLLQYTLSELFDARQGSVITPETYQALGGVRGALAKRAQQLYEQLAPHEQHAAQQLFLRLITLGEGTEDTRRRVLLTEITSMQSDIASTLNEEVMRTVVDKLGSARLLTFDRDPVTRSPTVEVTHEAIIREWDTLRAWLDESRNDVRMQRALSNLANEWNENNRDRSFLLRGIRLDSYETWVAETTLSLTESERRYMQASVEMRRQQEQLEQAREARERELEQRSLNRARIIAVVLAVATIGALILSGYAFQQTARAVAESAESDSIAWEASARQALSEENGDLAIMLAMQAVDMENPPPQALSTLAEVAFAHGTRAVFSGHGTAWVQDVAISPDGSLVASGSTDSTVLVWDASTDEVIYSLDAHGGDVESVAFSPDGQYLITTAVDFVAILWDMATGTEVTRFDTSPAPVRDAVFTPDGTQVMTVSNDGGVFLWDIATGERTSFEGHGASTVLTVAISPDGNQAVTGARDGVLYLWDMPTQTPQLLADYDAQINDVAFSEDGTTLVAGSGDGFVYVWDTETATLRNTLSGNLGEVRGVQLTPDGSLLYVAALSGAIEIFDMETGIVVNSLIGHDDSALGLAMSADGQTLVSGAKDADVRVWNIGLPGAEDAYNHASRVQDVVMSTDSNLVYSASVDGTLTIFDRAQQTITSNFDLPDAPFSLAISSDDAFAVVGSRGAAYVIGLSTGDTRASFDTSDGRIDDVVILGDNQRALLASSNDIIHLIDIRTGDEIARYEGHTDQVNGLALLPDQTQFVSVSSDTTIIRWDIATAEALFIYNADSNSEARSHQQIITTVAVNPQGTQMVTAGRDGYAVVWDLETGIPSAQIVSDEQVIWSVAFDSTGDKVVLGSEQGGVLVWDITQNRTIERFDIGSTTVFSVAFAPDGNSIVSGQGDASVIIWHLYDGDELKQWVRDNRYLRGWECLEIGQYRLPPDTACDI